MNAATPADRITIDLAIWDAGCLPGMLRRRIEEVEHTKRSGALSPEAMENADLFIGQMRGVLAALAAAFPPGTIAAA
jgi:hypothetical protein